jgi:antitoxin (DNA-binding transcriptional repressor) of toxin-antitoxin stability system
MKETVISVTEASRNFAECINRAHYQNVTFILQKNGVPVARIVPEGNKTVSNRELAAVMRRNQLSPEEARIWRQDLRNAYKALKPPVDKWR